MSAEIKSDVPSMQEIGEVSTVNRNNNIIPHPYSVPTQQPQAKKRFSIPIKTSSNNMEGKMACLQTTTNCCE